MICKDCKYWYVDADNENYGLCSLYDELYETAAYDDCTEEKKIEEFINNIPEKLKYKNGR